jgi:hypothetical protein
MDSKRTCITPPPPAVPHVNPRVTSPSYLNLDGASIDPTKLPPTPPRPGNPSIPTDLATPRPLDPTHQASNKEPTPPSEPTSVPTIDPISPTDPNTTACREAPLERRVSTRTRVPRDLLKPTHHGKVYSAQNHKSTNKHMLPALRYRQTKGDFP